MSTESDAPLKLCHGPCRLLKLPSQFAYAFGHRLNICQACHRRKYSQAHKQMCKERGSVNERMVRKPRVPTGLKTLPQWDKRPPQVRGGSKSAACRSSDRSLFRNLPAHLRPLAHERLQWMLRRHPQSGPGTRKYPIIVANVASMVINTWREAARGTKYHSRMFRWKLATVAVKRKLGILRNLTPEERAQGGDIRREQTRRHRARMFVPSQHALSLALSIPYASSPQAAKKRLTVEAEQRRMHAIVEGAQSTDASTRPSQQAEQDPFVQRT